MKENIAPISPEVLQAKQRFGIIGNAPALVAAVERALRVAPIDLSVLVTGESGAGKEFFPQIIHTYSARKHSKYIAVNCGAIPEGTIDSELFGHEKGAFTGAVDSRKGYFEEANGGTIFLDEVAELPLTTQARLLRVLETGEFIKVGSSTVQKTSVRIVAATNVDLLAAVSQGRFREDLYYRLSTIQIHVPPLRDRGQDIRLLSRKFAADFSERYRMPQISFSEEADDAMRHYRWPGNVRQLKNVVEQLALFQAGDVIRLAVLSEYLPSVSSSYMPALTGTDMHSYEREREMLFGMIFNLQSRIDELQERIGKNTFSTSLVMRPKEVPAPSDSCSEVSYSEVIAHPVPAPGIVRAEPLSASEQPASLEDNERELIRRALERNEGRRKAAAAELKISERTLYRKIKEYGME